MSSSDSSSAHSSLSNETEANAITTQTLTHSSRIRCITPPPVSQPTSPLLSPSRHLFPESGPDVIIQTPRGRGPYFSHPPVLVDGGKGSSSEVEVSPSSPVAQENKRKKDGSCAKDGDPYMHICNVCYKAYWSPMGLFVCLHSHHVSEWVEPPASVQTEESAANAPGIDLGVLADVADSEAKIVE